MVALMVCCAPVDDQASSSIAVTNPSNNLVSCLVVSLFISAGISSLFWATGNS